MPDPAEPALIMYLREDGGLLVEVRPHAFDDPAEWGIAVADVVANIVGSLTREGVALPSGELATPEQIRERLMAYLWKELTNPTDIVKQTRAGNA